MILQNKQKKRVCDFNLFTWAQGWHSFHLKKGKDFNVYGQINILWHWSYTNLLFMLKQSSLFLFDQFLNPSLGTVLITHIFSNHNVPACSDLCYWDQECPLLLFQIFFFFNLLYLGGPICELRNKIHPNKHICLHVRVTFGSL